MRSLSFFLLSAPLNESIGIILSSAIAVKLFDLIYNEIKTWRDKRRAAAAAHASQSAEVRRIGLEEVDVVISSLQGEVSRLQKSLDHSEQRQIECHDKINKITIENLRLLAQLKQHEWLINELQRKLGIEVTDFGRSNENRTDDNVEGATASDASDDSAVGRRRGDS